MSWVVRLLKTSKAMSYRKSFCYSSVNLFIRLILERINDLESSFYKQAVL